MIAASRSLHLTGAALSFADLEAIGGRQVSLAADAAAMARVQAAREVLDDHIARGHPIYGATTGVGAMKDRSWSAADREAFNRDLVLAHGFGIGDRLSARILRKAIALRLNSALTGHAGTSTAFVSALLDLARHDILPVVHRLGSIGCADIGLMGQIGCAMAGAGEAELAGQRMPAAQALARAGLVPMVFAPRDSLAAISSNAVALAAGAEALRDAALALRLALVSGLLAAGALGAAPDPWICAAHQGPASQAEIGRWLVASAASWPWQKATHIQDPLSIRMMAQVSGSGFETLLAAGQKLLAATGQSDDNPMVIGDRVLTSGGSLPLEVALSLQAAQLGVAHVARSQFNRIVLMANGGRKGLPVNLVPPPGHAATGFGPMVKLAGDLFSRVLALAAPVSAQLMALAGGIEDEASFLPQIVERLEEQLSALRTLTAVEALFAAQAVDISGETPQGPAGALYDLTRRHSARHDHDRRMSGEIAGLDHALARPETRSALLAAAPLTNIDRFFAL